MTISDLTENRLPARFPRAARPVRTVGAVFRLAVVLSVLAVMLASAPLASASHDRPDLYPRGVGEVDTGYQVILKLMDALKYRGIPLNQCFGGYRGVRHQFTQAYREEQAYIRREFEARYRLGYPSTYVRMSKRGNGGLGLRFYQLFQSGSWGASSLTQPQSRLGILDIRYCFQKPKLITGVIFAKWSAVGHVATLGGPTRHQYRNGPYIQQDFERGQIGFADPRDVWWRPCKKFPYECQGWRR